MVTATLVEPKRFQISESEPPEPGPGAVRIDVRGCGLCASNLGPWHGIAGVRYPLDPGAPGHEVYGSIDAVGSGVDGLNPGDVVAALSYNGFAEYDTAPADAVLPLPPGLADCAVLGEPLACAVNVFRRAEIAPGDTVAIVGTGFLGALLVRLARSADPARVVAIARRAEGREMARRMGADRVLSMDDDVIGRIARLTSDRMADVVIEATGKQAPLELAADLTRIRGRLVIAGYHQDGPRAVNLQLWNWRGLDVINAHERDPAIYVRGMTEAVRLLDAGTLEVEPLLTHFVPLPEINRAFDLAERRPSGFFKAVIVPGNDS